MKRLLSTLLLTLWFGSASAAMYLDPHGQGQVLLYPYYTVNAGQSSLIGVVNTTARGKFVRVSFHQGMSGEETMGSWKDTRDRHVEPLGLVLKAGAWYLVARRGSTPRTYKVSNIRSLSVLSQRFEPAADFDLPQHWRAALEQFEVQLRPLQARLRASAEGRARLAELGTYAAQAVAAARPSDDAGWAELSLPIEHIEQAALLLLGLGPEVVAVEPHLLRERVVQLAQLVVDRTSRA